MNIEELTIKQVREIQAMRFGSEPKHAQAGPHPVWATGNKVFIRTVTHHHTGIVVSYNEYEIILQDAAWIPSDGRFSDALKKSEFEEVEPFPDGIVVIGRGSIIDACVINSVPRSQK